MTQILVVKPGTLTVGDKRKLRRADVVTVEAETPQDVRLIGAEGAPLDGNDLFFAAMSALVNPGGTGFASDARSAFAKALHSLLTDQRKAREAE